MKSSFYLSSKTCLIILGNRLNDSKGIIMIKAIKGSYGYDLMRLAWTLLWQI